MVIKYKYYNVDNNDVVQHVITGVDHVQVCFKHLFYWKVGHPQWMYRLNLGDINDVRLENETTNDSDTR